MSAPHCDRRRIYNLDYFLGGGIERRIGAWSRQVDKGEPLGRDRSRTSHAYPLKFEVPRGKKRRGGTDRHKTTKKHYIWL